MIGLYEIAQFNLENQMFAPDDGTCTKDSNGSSSSSGQGASTSSGQGASTGKGSTTSASSGKGATTGSSTSASSSGTSGSRKTGATSSTGSSSGKGASTGRRGSTSASTSSSSGQGASTSSGQGASTGRRGVTTGSSSTSNSSTGTSKTGSSTGGSTSSGSSGAVPLTCWFASCSKGTISILSQQYAGSCPSSPQSYTSQNSAQTAAFNGKFDPTDNTCSGAAGKAKAVSGPGGAGKATAAAGKATAASGKAAPANTGGRDVMSSARAMKQCFTAMCVNGAAKAMAIITVKADAPCPAGESADQNDAIDKLPKDANGNACAATKSAAGRAQAIGRADQFDGDDAGKGGDDASKGGGRAGSSSKSGKGNAPDSPKGKGH